MLLPPSSIWAAEEAEKIPLEEKSVTESAFGFLNEALHRQFVRAAGLGDVSEKPDSREKGFDAELDRITRLIFVTVDGKVFTNQVIGATKKPVQLEGLEFSQPNGSPLTEADRLNGIDRRVSVRIRAKAWRIYEEGNWSEWKPRTPVLMSGFSLERRSGEWKTASSPFGHYSAR